MGDIYTNPPQSRNEAILESIVEGTEYTDPPQSRIEDLLLEVKEVIEQGGSGGTTVVANPTAEATDDLEKLQVGSTVYGIPVGADVEANPQDSASETLTKLKVDDTIYSVPNGGSGTSDYTELTNKPQINGNTLSGNKTGADLGLVDAVSGKGLSTNDFTDALETKLEGIAAGAEVNVQADWTEADNTADSYIQNKPNLATVATSGSYNDLSNKPSIPAAQVNADWSANSGVAQILNKPTLGTAAAKDSTNAITQSSTDLVESGAVYSALADKVSKSQIAGLLKNDGTVDTTEYAELATEEQHIETGTTASVGYMPSALIWIEALTGTNGSHLFRVKEGVTVSAGDNWASIKSTKLTETTVTEQLSNHQQQIRSNSTALTKAYSTDDTAETAIDDADYFPYYDTSATAKRKTLWSNIKSVLKTYFDTLYNKITVSVAKTGTASSSAFRKQVITIDNVSTDIDGSAYMEQSVTLSTSAATTVTFTNAAIDDGAMLTVATSLWNLVPDDITLASGSCTITLPKWATAETIGVRLYVR